MASLAHAQTQTHVIWWVPQSSQDLTMHILALVITSKCWSSAQFGLPPDPVQMHANGCCSRAQLGLPIATAHSSPVRAAAQLESFKRYLARSIPAPDLINVCGCFDPTWSGLPIVSALTRECCILTQPDVAHPLSLLSYLPVSTETCCRLTYPQT